MKQPPKTKEEARERLEQGERFKYEGHTFFYDESAIYRGHSTYCVKSWTGGISSIFGFWEFVTKWQPIQSDEDKLIEDIKAGKKPLCWVSDIDEEIGCAVRKVCFFNNSIQYKYKEIDGAGWKYATRVKPEELCDE